MSVPCYVCNKTQVEPSRALNKDNQPISAFNISCEYCGRYLISNEVINLKYLEQYKEQMYLLSSAIFKNTKLGEITELTTESIPELIKTTVRKPIFETINNMLEYFSQKADSITDWIGVSDKDIPRFVLKDKKELDEYIIQIKTLNFWDFDTEMRGKEEIFYRVHFTLNGWKKIDDIRKTKIDSNQAFVAMWFEDSMDQYYIDGIKPALEKTGFNPIVNVKEIQHNDKIDDLIIAQIRKSGLLIAECTGNRPAVYFEAGFAKGLDIEVIWLCRKSDEDELSFDTRQYNHIFWEDADDLKEQLINRIEATIKGHLAK